MGMMDIGLGIHRTIRQLWSAAGTVFPGQAKKITAG